MQLCINQSSWKLLHSFQGTYPIKHFTIEEPNDGQSANFMFQRNADQLLLRLLNHEMFYRVALLIKLGEKQNFKERRIIKKRK